MVDNYKAWNIAKIRMLFPYHVVERNMATPLIGSVYEDKLYIIRSDKYHVEGNWKEMWKSHAPHKERRLFWRLCRGCLPTRCRLFERNVDCEIQCPLCEEEVEDDVHTFFTRASALSSWQTVGLSSVMVFAACQQGSATDRVFALCRNEDYETIGRVASLFWSIWHNRNDKIWNDNLRTPSQVGRDAFDHWSEWFVVHKMRSPDDHYAPPLSTDRWEKPRLEWLKCNVDAAFFVDSGGTTMSACFRNSSGEFTAGFTKWQHMVLSTEEGEA
ncbi:uncharacterized protein LOC123892220 [Trifolium pratense]|uniref:uncharacterized protein LOC123892220 n=1 Tax=Trifolium pratense TaxID=57577 RepID=UPI001E694EE0|nr:uncharacterized protein LOC123892220 [Trifolium pratense]